MNRQDQGLLTRLRRDRSGNTLAMAAMSLIPLSALIGSGVDMSRAYLVKTRLQSACDAGVLAARKTMDGSPTLNAGATAAGNSFFANNFPTGTYGTSTPTFTMALGAEQVVNGTATTIVPMSLMKMFNFNDMPVNVGCQARLDITNTDVMFVLDTTGSMLQCPDGSACNGDANSRIAGLRAAVMDFTNTLSTAAPATARIRYGFVPYSSTVNVGALVPAAQMQGQYAYRSRRASFNTPVNPVVTSETAPTLMTDAQCTTYGNAASSTSTDANNFTTTTSYARRDWGGTGTTTGTTRTCRRNRTVSVSPQAWRFSGWSYGLTTSYDTTTFRSGANVNIGDADPPSNYYVATQSSYNLVDLAALPNYTAMGGSVQGTRWGGCIEERDTTSDATFAWGSMPANAFDLNIPLPGTNWQTRWRSSWPEIIYQQDGTGFYRPWDNRANGFWACPTASRRLATMTQAEVQTYVNSLVPIGGTYHDSGMIWGARLIHPTGIFAADHAPAPNNQPVARNIIFMTDGQMAPNQFIYGLYGLESLDQRVLGGAAADTLDDRHNSRFVAVCDAIRAQNVRIWVIGFGTALNTQLTACADPGQAFQASDTATLRAQFNAIATRIAKLRLAQ